MKHFKITVFGVLILFATLSSMPQSKGSNDSEASAELRISTPKNEYLLGEPVKLERREIKIGDFDHDRFPQKGPNTTDSVFIAKGDGEFKRYYFKYPLLPDAESFGGLWYIYDTFYFYTIFFNSKPETDGLSDYGRRIAEKGMILTDYAFPEPGEYRIKATHAYSVRGRSDASLAVAESNEISITVKEPQGDDRRVWEMMNSDIGIGSFMMEGVPPYHIYGFRNARTPDEILSKVDKIVADYPKSYLAGLLKVKAQECRARQERIKQEAEQERLKKEKAAGASKIN